VTVVLDTDVIVAALVANGLCHEVVVRALGSGTVVSSTDLLDELDRTLRAKFSLGPAASGFLKQLRIRVRLVEPMTLPSPVARDVDDDVVLATAVAAGAGLIVTGDHDLLVIGRYKQIEIVSPREFLTRATFG
jgi:putative PIN family toxin of toxin-antitoxin system